MVHGVLFDLFRTPASRAGARSAAALKLRLAGAKPSVLLPPVPAPAELPVLPKQTGKVVSPHSELQPGAISEVRSASPFLSSGREALAGEPSPAGFRPLSVDEGKTAYRLALLAAMPPGWPALSGTPLRLELAFDAGGHLRASRVLQGSGETTTDLAWQRFVTDAVERAALPEVLGSLSFLLELEILD